MNWYCWACAGTDDATQATDNNAQTEALRASLPSVDVFT
ncbi:hypothetical protein Z947_2536 [Sulfitobacter geojensis]|nr:hypothetical protein Z947_2536 [Sulfitobacter geojensis]